MAAVFEKLLEMSLTASVVIVVVLVMRLLLRKAPRKYSYALWSVAAFRLVCPVSFRSMFSLFTLVERVEQVELTQTVPNPIAPSIPPASTVTPPVSGTLPSVTVPVPGNPVVEPEPVVDLLERAVDMAAILWLAVLAGLLLYGVVSYVRLRRRMSTAVMLEGNVWQSDRVQSPFILGFVRPKIYLPFGLSEDQRRYVLAHERYHLKRLDHIVRPLSFLVLAVHWFNPLVWLAYYLMSRDMEMSCDEKVLSTEENIRKAYSTTLLSFAANRRFPSPSPLAFGESGVKGRIKNALNWKKPTLWVTIAAIVVCIVVIVVCAANPKEPRSEAYDWISSRTNENVDSVWVALASDKDNYVELTEAEKENLIRLLHGVKQEDCDWFAETVQPYDSDFELHERYDYDPSQPGGSRIILGNQSQTSVGILTYSPNSRMYLILIEIAEETIETRWYIDNTELEQFMAGLAEELPPEPNLPVETEFLTYVSSKCIYLNLASSALPVSDSGYCYTIGENKVWIAQKGDPEQIVEVFDDLGDWRPLSEEEWSEMFLGGASMGADISGFENPRIRDLSDRYALVDVDGTLWIANVHEHGYVWDVYELTLERGNPQRETISVWQADLTQDGVGETITVTYIPEWRDYQVEVSNAYGQVIWSDTSNLAHMGWNGIYLYEWNGVQYLMRWLPYGSTGMFDYFYEIFALTESGEESRLTHKGFSYDTASKDSTLAVNTAAMRVYESEVNGRLENAIVLITTDEGNPVYSTPDNPVTLQWTCPADQIESWQQSIREEQAERLANTLGIWTADVNHDGTDETITILETEDENKKRLEVHLGDYYLWGTELDVRAHDRSYFLYEEDGKEYLAEFGAGISGRTGTYFYRVFRVLPESLDVRYENTLQVDVLSPDADAVRNFEREVGGLLADADIIASVESGRFIYSPQRTDTVFRWYDGVFGDIEELFANGPYVFVTDSDATEQENNFIISYLEELIKAYDVHFDGAEIVQVELIPTGTVGENAGEFMYRVKFQLYNYWDDGKPPAMWSPVQDSYMVTHREYLTVRDQELWSLVGIITEEELQSRYNKPEVLEKYGGDLYLAATVEMTTQSRMEKPD